MRTRPDSRKGKLREELKGWLRGWRKGKQKKGKAEERVQTLKGLLNLIAAGVPVETIASCMGLSPDELEGNCSR